MNWHCLWPLYPGMVFVITARAAVGKGLPDDKDVAGCWVFGALSILLSIPFWAAFIYWIFT